MTTQELISKLAEMSGALAVAMLLGLSPRIQAVPPVGFKYPQRETKFALSLSAVLLVLTVIFYYFPSQWISAEKLGLSNDVNNLFNLAIITLIAVIAVLTLIRVRRQPLRSIGWHTALLRPAIQFSLALMILTLFLQGEFMALFTGLPENAIWALGLCLWIGLGEETVFRGFIQQRLNYRFGTTRGLLLTSLIYCLWRLPFLAVFGWGSQSFWLAAGILILQSLLLGWIMHKSRHVLVPALYHAISMWIVFM